VLISWTCGTYQRSQRQYSRLQGMVKNIYGGKKNLQQFLENEKFVDRRLKTVELGAADMKPLVKRRRRSTNQPKAKDARARRKRKYNEFLAKDLMDPANATKRTARHFILIRETMEYTRQEYKCFARTLRGPPRHHCAVAQSAAHKARANTRRTRGRARRHGSTSTTTC
jgi:hypothetical protein